MAHFQLLHDNSRGKYYSVNDPTTSHAKGWHSGVNVELRKTEYGDKFYIWMTSGSDTQQRVNTLLGVVTTVDNSPVYTPAQNGLDPS